jgi:hypothetical protein
MTEAKDSSVGNTKTAFDEQRWVDVVSGAEHGIDTVEPPLLIAGAVPTHSAFISDCLSLSCQQHGTRAEDDDVERRGITR